MQELKDALNPKTLLYKNPIYEKVKTTRDKRKHREGSRLTYPPIYLNDNEKNKAKANNFPSNIFTTSKYSLWTFVPLVLWEQFSKVTTLYFTAIFVISAIPAISPIKPWTSLLGLCFILVVAAGREAWEDFLRHKADRRVNQRRYLLIEGDGERVVTRSRWLHVGNLVYVRCDEQIPADLVLLATSNEDGICYIETSQLDGETNLKPRKAPTQTGSFTLAQLSEMKGILQCEVPHHVMYSFKGTLKLEGDDHAIPLDQQQLLLQSSFLRNTDWVVGVIAYAGPETKLSLNQKKPPFKTSRLDRRLNRYVLVLFTVNMLMCLAMAILGGFFEKYYARDNPYLTEDSSGASVAGVKLFFSYFALLSFLIPLSLVVSLELVKVIQARFMEWDYEMSIESGGMTVKTSNLNDELALVHYVFSDKTGTLTENQMDFKKCSVRGTAYNNASDGALRGIMQVASKKEAADIHNFLVAMAVCHSAVTDFHKKTKELIYKASSPDEEALCRAAKDNNYTFVTRSNRDITVQIDDNKFVFEVLCSMEFTSERRRMSVLIRTPEGEIKLISKGADTMMYSRLRDGEDDLKQKTLEDLDNFSKEGLRTLVYGERILSENECRQFMEAFAEASLQFEGRDEALEELCDSFERHFVLVGATAIEDKLQEGVPETIAYLLEAGMHVWVITGDKQATAINIGYSSRLLTPEMDVIKINATSSEETLEMLRGHMHSHDHDSSDSQALTESSASHKMENMSLNLDRLSKPKQKKRAMVIDGDTLKFALKDHPKDFVNFARTCHSVICNRVTPLQKAKVVRLMNDSSGQVSLAIGDGANDVGMIQEANVGVGIYGKEGNQAARASDFALRQFRHLKRLICVHGRYSMIRNALIIHYSFYKNAAVFLVQIWFGIFSGFSGQTIYDDWIMTFFNILFTSWPPIAIAVFETDIPTEIIEEHPRVYERVQSNKVFTLKSLGLWLMAAVYHSLVLFFGAYFLWGEEFVGIHGRTLGFYTLGNAILIVGILIVFLKLVLTVNNWNWLVHVTIWGSMTLYVIIVIAENSIQDWFPHQFFVFFHMASEPAIYFWLPLGTIIALLPDFVFTYVQRTFFPENWQILQEDYKHLTKKQAKTYGVFKSKKGSLNAGESTHQADVQAAQFVGVGVGTYSRLEEPLIHTDDSHNNSSSSSH